VNIILTVYIFLQVFPIILIKKYILLTYLKNTYYFYMDRIKFLSLLFCSRPRLMTK